MKNTKTFLSKKILFNFNNLIFSSKRLFDIKILSKKTEEVHPNLQMKMKMKTNMKMKNEYEKRQMIIKMKKFIYHIRIQTLKITIF